MSGVVINLAPCRVCGRMPTKTEFEAPSNSFLARVSWTRLACHGSGKHAYTSILVEAESLREAIDVWNDLMDVSYD